MAAQEYADELERALSRVDADKLTRQIDAYATHHANGFGDWPDEHSDDFAEIIDAGSDDPDKALAYVMLATAHVDDPGFVGLMACSLLEDVLSEPSPEMIERVVKEAGRSPRFRWLLSHPFKVAVSDAAWSAIEPFRITGPHEEPPPETLPPRA